MFEKINGLPAHVLLVHVVIVLVPIACLMLVAGVAFPAARARMGVMTPIVAFVALVFVPITTHAGEWLRDNLGFSSAQIRKHAELGDTLLPWAAGVFVLAAAVWFADRKYTLGWKQVEPEPESAGGGSTATAVRTRTQLPVWVSAVVLLVCLAVAVGTVITLYRIGDSGAHAVWGGRSN